MKIYKKSGMHLCVPYANTAYSHKRIGLKKLNLNKGLQSLVQCACNVFMFIKPNLFGYTNKEPAFAGFEEVIISVLQQTKTSCFILRKYCVY
ncbi:hypothetical protein KsCSTR_16850 [Candidatus Kuenenia stuttgartiensis]|uniref:Uncharacterized protein n=2 Tax=Kuenenia stuttgartiensis TaxID=174633 RepID=A0A6G7GNY3_KUEST|nr:hypothetical protein KsCSTR_16850 [Candidatus Kuenenia stuttgartiensis]